MSALNSETEKIRDLLGTFSTAMLITHEADGRLRARPMAIADLEDDCTLWFITAEDSAKAHEIERDTRTHVVCQQDHSVYLSLSGQATLVLDRSRIAQLWQESFRVWFPGGKDDPSIALIAFRPERIEYWDSTGLNKVALLWESARAYVAGKTPRVKEGEQHGVVHVA